ncbi:DNA replication complex GINS protein PSF3 [Anoplophora glabripennis]|uniref:DNA replication complex GINS protein PSF3 n=1 Tax=Anoplophora glabripennis TaxID=217634 RepID=UPI0008743C47|nr:DNA replication complex GINS protein PSF3 [Anoplophora glabripennis]
MKIKMPLPLSYFPNYYSIDDILATQERVPCKFLLNIPKMGKLNPSAAETDLAAGTNLELPVWLVLEMSTGRQPVVQPELPKIYRHAYQEILKADACAVDLHRFNLYFFELGWHIKHFDMQGHVHTVLLDTFKTRFRQLMDLANNSLSNPSVQRQLDTLEKTIFKDGYNARMKLNHWLIQSEAAIEAASMVVNHKKRKRIDISN